MVSVVYKDPFLKVFNSTLMDLPSPANISRMWNFGSLLRVCLITQILRGLFLALHFSGNTELSFIIVIQNHLDVNFN
jgi:ubiquinol-cytochrome c reductase cytochrome b subunit